jgi:predicted glycosyltransferase
MALGVLKRAIRQNQFCSRFKPDIMTGTSVENSILGPLRHIPVVNCNEDDAAVVPLYAKLSYPGADAILNPVVCNSGKWDTKATKYPSYQELAYLHPNHFTADKNIVEGYGIDITKPYFVMRFASLKAHHDDGVKGINTEIAQRLVDILSPHGQIYITSERELEPQFEPYRIRINPLDMHHVMAFASLYIGDSQTMAAEAGVLGTPFVRFNDFVGRIGYLRELEDVYQLGYGIHASPLTEDSTIRRNDGTLQPSGTDALYSAVEQLVAMPANERRTLFTSRREQMLSEKIDYAKFLTWFIEEYPASAKETRDNQQKEAFWQQFK